MKRYKVVAYAVLVKAGLWILEGEGKPVIPEGYKIAVAEYLAEN